MYDKYKYYVNEKKGEVIAVCRFAGRNVKGKAVCAPGDTFDIEIGKKLARLKCEYKVACKRYRHAVERYNFTIQKVEEAYNESMEAQEYLQSSIEKHNIVCDEIEEMLKELGATPNQED